MSFIASFCKNQFEKIINNQVKLTKVIPNQLTQNFIYNLAKHVDFNINITF